MRKTTCPWCGKSLKPWEIKKVETGKSFMNFTIAKCVHCRKNYGQSYNFDSIWPFIVAIGVSLLFMYIFHPYFLFGIAASLYATVFVPYTRFDNLFEPIKDTRTLYKLTVISGEIRKKRYYLTSDFDSLPAFSTVSPIEIRKIKKDAIYCCFTYDYVQNSEFFDKEINLYNINGDLIATAKLQYNT